MKKNLGAPLNRLVNAASNAKGSITRSQRRIARLLAEVDDLNARISARAAELQQLVAPAKFIFRPTPSADLSFAVGCGQ